MAANHVSYPGLKCILEYLDAMRRIHITARSRSLQRIDNTIPLRLERLKLAHKSLRIDRILIEFTPDEMIFDIKNVKKVIRLYRGPESPDEAMRAINAHYLGGRSKTCVDDLSLLVSLPETSLLPANLKIRVNGLDNFCWYTENYIRILDIECFPLERMHSFKAPPPEIYPVPRFAKSLTYVIFIYSTITDNLNLDHFKRLDCRHVFIDYDSKPARRINAVEIVRYWMETRKEIGMTLTFFGSHFSQTKKTYEELEAEFSEFLTVGEENRSLRISIPILAYGSKIHIYGRGLNPRIRSATLVMKVVSMEEEDTVGIIEDFEPLVSD